MAGVQFHNDCIGSISSFNAVLQDVSFGLGDLSHKKPFDYNERTRKTISDMLERLNAAGEKMESGQYVKANPK